MDNTVKGFQTNEGTKQYDYNALANLPTLISQDDINGVVVNALEQAKQNGDFKGDKGDDYVLTDADKTEIAEQAAALVEVPDSGGNVGYVVQDTAPEDISVLWVDPTDNTDNSDNSDDGFQEAVNAALAQAKESGEFDGEPGKTPVKGTDYYTEADKAEMVNAVLAALPTWTGGSY